MTSEKLNCWEVLECGREPGGSRESERGPCSAATDTTCDRINSGVNAGRFCWAVGGTLCGDPVRGTIKEKIEACRQCAFFRRVKYEEGCHFQTLRPGLGATEAGDLHRLLNDVAKLLGICRDIFACLAVQPLLARIVEHACAITRASSASAYLVDAAGERLVLETHAGPVIRPNWVGMDEDGPVAEAARRRRLCQGTAVLAGCGDPVAVAAVPIGGADKLAGVLELVEPDNRFSVDDEWFLQELSLIAGLGIENARHIDHLYQLKRFDKAKSRFVALLMHHISSPLATIACSLQAILQIGEDLAREDRQKLIEISQERIESIQALSRRLLDLAAIRSGTSLAESRPVSPADPLREEVEGRLAHAQEQGIKLVVAEHGGHARVLADPDGLRLIFGNLIGNAIKYSGGSGKKVDVDLAAERGVVRVCIRDRGIGIPADEQTRVFEEFHRASNVTEANASGFGLGLAMVKELVDRYGGRIELDSQVGVGTSVSVTFPIATDAATQDTSP
jgi:two-component system phosphate regulon sensor histidine kinase PhoR